MFAKLFIVAIAVVCASAGYPGTYSTQSASYPLAYSAGVVPTYSYTAPVASYSTFSGTPFAYSTYSGNPTAYSTYGAPAVRTFSYY